LFLMQTLKTPGEAIKIQKVKKFLYIIMIN
jgi:hypothetical protein